MTTQTEVLPRELRLGAPPTMPQARSYLFKQKSTLSTYLEKSTIQINIPRLQRSYLTNDSYLQFTVAIKSTPGYINNAAGKAFTLNQMLTLDTPGAYGFIDKIEVYDYLGSTLLESTSGHGQLAALLLDATSVDVLSRKLNTHAGTGKTLVGANHVLSAYGNSDLTGANAPTADNRVNTNTVFGPVSGAPFEYSQSANGWIPDASVPGTTPPNAEETIQKEFSIPLFSFLGLLSPKYVPLHNGFTINITLNSRAIAMGRYNLKWAGSSTAGSEAAPGTITSFQVQDVYFCSQVLELGPVAESMLLSSTQGNPLIVHTKAYRNFVSYMDVSTNNFRFDLNLNVASMTAILWFMRPTFNLLSANAEYCRSLSQRIRNFMTSWYFQYGSSILPQTTGIKTMTNTTFDSTNRSGRGVSEAFVELMKALRKNNLSPEESCFTDLNFSQDVQVTGTFSGGAFSADSTQAVLDAPPPLLIPGSRPQKRGYDPDGTQYGVSTVDDVGRFACGLNLQLSPEHGYEVVSGLNTNGMNTSINATFAPSKLANQQQVQVDAYCEYDAFINITPGLASTVSF